MSGGPDMITYAHSPLPARRGRGLEAETVGGDSDSDVQSTSSGSPTAGQRSHAVVGHRILDGQSTEPLRENGRHAHAAVPVVRRSTEQSVSPSVGTLDQMGGFMNNGYLSQNSTPTRLHRMNSYERHQSQVRWKPTYELDGQPLPDLDHHFYSEQQDPEPEKAVSYAFVDCWRSLSHFQAFIMKNYYLHIVIAVLIVMDIIIVVGQLILDLEIVLKSECHNAHDCPLLIVNRTDAALDCTLDVHLSKCIYKDGLRRCENEHTEPDLDPSDILHYLSISVLACFVLETIARVVALRKDFFKRKIEVFDAIVVITAFALDVSIGHDAALALLMFIRLWRVTRIINGAAIAIESREAHRRVRLTRKVRRADAAGRRKVQIIKLLRKELAEWQKAAFAMYPLQEESADELDNDDITDCDILSLDDSNNGFEQRRGTITSMVPLRVPNSIETVV